MQSQYFLALTTSYVHFRSASKYARTKESKQAYIRLAWRKLAIAKAIRLGVNDAK